MYQQSYQQVPIYGSYQPPIMPQRPIIDTSQRQGIPLLKGRPVTSLEEARACMIDFDGSMFYFPDPSNRRIYTKQINLDGTATLCTYEYVEAPTGQIPPVDPSYVSQKEFKDTIQAVLGEINKIKGVETNDESKQQTDGE